MSTIIVEPNIVSLLSQLQDITEIRDPNGNVIGTFTPAGKIDEKMARIFDLKKAREKLAAEQSRPFREMVDKLERLASKQG